MSGPLSALILRTLEVTFTPPVREEDPDLKTDSSKVLMTVSSTTLTKPRF